MSMTLDRAGQLLSWELRKSSGSPVLDEEGSAAVQRAAPYPPFPSTMPQKQLLLTVALEFSLEDFDKSH